eukprot:gnl/TRDRNA2_/TRDRNA2_45037_c0_seq1.p1 gnl/TRDRNA2_/TRDRNA2_45037_c0~~gnl/TRDRNA2_/TRDRNA2_45037_c0_seq1.p1  ORF type:complete len:190 (-),score=23.06 gnl/TRDRNA2_/TRDRNA2_45037_c0_seq1:59-628(-)
MAAAAAAGSRRGRHVLSAAVGLPPVLGLGFWEGRRLNLLGKYEEVRQRYRESGGESRFPFYGRDFGYDVDYMIELGLDAGDKCQARFKPEVLHAHHAAALIAWRWRVGDNHSLWDEEATVEIVDGRRHCRHSPRPAAWWVPWWPGSTPETLTPYSEWLAWPAISEVVVLPKSGNEGRGRKTAATLFNVR